MGRKREEPIPRDSRRLTIMTAERPVLTAAERNLALAWVLAVAAGWVLGFYLCGVIENWLSTFFIDGLVIGSAIGIAQGLVLRRNRIAPMLPWVVVSIIGFGVGKFFGDVIGQGSTSLVSIALSGAIIGLVAGIAQSVVLMDRFSNAWWWIVANVVAWIVGWTLIGLLNESASSLVMTYADGAFGAMVIGVITAITLVALSRHPVPKPINAEAEAADPRQA
jgi:hypothetical protein